MLSDESVNVLDLTLPVEDPEPQREGPGGATRMVAPYTRRDWVSVVGGREQTARVYYFHHWSMSGTYLDLPGHLADTDDGADTANHPLDRLFRVPAALARLDREDGSGGIDADELIAACVSPPDGGAFVINALGGKRFDEVATRSVWLRRDAVEWLVSTGVHLVVSDVYESDAEHQAVFRTLFAAGIVTVCRPINLHRVQPDGLRVTALPLRAAGVTQMPCRVVAEWNRASEETARGPTR